MISFRDYLGLSKACSYDIDDIIGRADRFGFQNFCSPELYNKMGCVKRIWYLSPIRAAKVQASLCIRAVSPEPPLLAHTSSESRGTFRQKARSLNGWACAVTICHDGMLEDTNSLDGAQIFCEGFNYHNLKVPSGFFLNTLSRRPS